MTVAVDIAEVSRRFASTQAVDRVSLQVAQGEFVSLLGPSGCGKTTLLRLIGGFEQPDAGRIRILGEDVTDLPPNRRRTNMVFQHLALFPHLDVAENIGFGMMVRQRHAPEEIRRRVLDALARVRLEGYEGRRVHELSGGQRQRVAIARAIVNEPRVLLLDEPLGALDLQLRLDLQAELRQLQRSLGSPFVFVTHDQGEAMAMSDRIAVMNRGRIEQIDTPRELYEKPATLFVARFLGHANVLAGRVVEADAAGGVRLDVGGYDVIGMRGAPLAPGQRATAVIRLEGVTLGPAGMGVDVTVEDIAFLGPSVRLRLRPASGPPLEADLALDRLPRLPQPGEAHGIAFDRARVWVFPTGEDSSSA